LSRSNTRSASQEAAEDELVTIFNLANCASLELSKSLTLGPLAFRYVYKMRHQPYLATGGLGGAKCGRHGSILGNSAEDA
jgi:hypothetical protein